MAPAVVAAALAWKEPSAAPMVAVAGMAWETAGMAPDSHMSRAWQRPRSSCRPDR